MEAEILILPGANGEGSSKEAILCWGLEAETDVQSHLASRHSANELIHAKCLVRCLAHGKCFKNISGSSY